jgi:small subunit ribosomal protein S1
MDRKGRTLQLSIKAKDEADTAEALAEYNKASDASRAPPSSVRCCASS